MADVQREFPPELFQHAVESVYDAVMITAPDSKGGEPPIVYVNPAFERLTGYSAADAIGNSPKMLHGEKTSESAMRQLHHALDEPFEGDTYLYRKDGTDYRAEFRVTPVRDEGGTVRNWIIAQRELEHNRLTEELEQRVKERTRELEGFLYTVSHDFRAPLRAIMSASMILIEDYGDKIDREGQSELKRQSAAAKKLGVLMDDLLRLSRLTRQEVHPEQIDLTALCREVASEVTARQSGETAEVTVAEGMSVTGDAALLRLLFQNLLENAVKFAKKGEPARIGIGQEGDAIYVRDEGIGFAPEKAERIFGPFERLHTEAEYPGNGVGLANVKRIVDRHSGRVWADGRPGEGSTFWVRLGQ